jgi:LemA protein
MSLTIFIVCSVLIAAWAVLTYNNIIRLQHKCSAAWSDVDVQLQRRFDLIPNLVNIVKTYAQHEQSTLQKVTLQRNNSDDIATRSSHENQLASQVNQLLLLVEKYPELKASDNFADLHKSLIVIENDIQFARRYFNGNIRDFNVQIESFPAFIIAKLFHFVSRKYFDIELVTQRQAPEVKL